MFLCSWIDKWRHLNTAGIVLTEEVGRVRMTEQKIKHVSLTLCWKLHSRPVKLKARFFVARVRVEFDSNSVSLANHRRIRIGAAETGIAEVWSVVRIIGDIDLKAGQVIIHNNSVENALLFYLDVNAVEVKLEM